MKNTSFLKKFSNMPFMLYCLIFLASTVDAPYFSQRCEMMQGGSGFFLDTVQFDGKPERKDTLDGLDTSKLERVKGTVEFGIDDVLALGRVCVCKNQIYATQ